jgi:hypothetical protein
LPSNNHRLAPGFQDGGKQAIENRRKCVRHLYRNWKIATTLGGRSQVPL